MMAAITTFVSVLLAFVSAPTAERSGSVFKPFYGKAPFAKVGNQTFLTHPAVTRLIATSAPPAWRARLRDGGVAEPVGPEQNGLMVVQPGCEPRNCDGRNWTIAIARDGVRGAICVFERGNATVSGWYSGHVKLVPVTGSCPNGRERAIPAVVLAHITGRDPWNDREA